MFRLSVSEGIVKTSKWTTIADYDSIMEMGGNFHGFHKRVAKDNEAA